jgi:hypothetical protein
VPLSTKLSFVRRKFRPLEARSPKLISTGYRVNRPRCGYLRMSGERARAHHYQHLPPIGFSHPSTEDQRTVPRIAVGSHPPINRLRGASQVFSWRIPLRLIAHQLASVGGIVTAELFLRSARCESLKHSNCQPVLEQWDMISWPATQWPDRRVLPC